MTTTKIDLNIPVKDLDGKPIDPAVGGGPLGRVLAQQIGSVDLSPAIKWLDWAMLLWKGQPLMLDDDDYALFVKTVEEFKNLTVLSKGQILRVIRDSRKQ
jgi:hypothetical protein